MRCRHICPVSVQRAHFSSATMSSIMRWASRSAHGCQLARAHCAVVSQRKIPKMCRNLHAAVKRRELIQTQGYIGGKWEDAGSGDHFAVLDPSTEKEVARVAEMGSQETNKAIEAAARAQRTWGETAPHARSTLLKKWHDAIRLHSEDLAMIASVECGKPIAEAKGEVAYAAGFIDYYAHECMHSAGFVVPSTMKGQHMVAIKQPVGVCGIITPWNFPLAMITRKIGPCLAAGCTAVIKPAAETPLSALALAKLAEEAGIPAGVINVVPTAHGKASEVGKALALSDQVRKLSFTGSTRVGKILMEQGASNIKRLSLELGGNAPFIVFDDANLEAAVEGLMQSKFRNTGQTCVCSNRIFVHDSVFDQFTERLVERVKSLKVGVPQDPKVSIGPLIGPAAFGKVKNLVDEAMDKGATALVGGKPNALGGNYFDPTILSNVDQSMQIWSEEIFGPVIALSRFTSEEEVVAKANCTDAGLAGYFYSQDLNRIWRVARALEVGMVGVNTGVVSSVQAPFGGVKQSGLGREGSPLGLEEYLETKLVSIGGLHQ